MFRYFAKPLTLLALLLAGAGSAYIFYLHTTSQYRVEQLEEENRQKELVISRLKAERRLAKVLVTNQKTVGGRTLTTLLFVEYRRDGSALPPRQFVIDGNEVHFDAEIVKFKDQYVEAGDPLRGQSILLFTRVYGAHQAPAEGFAIDAPGSIPEIYRGINPQISGFEQDLWKNFWSLYNDKDAREAKGIRGLHGEGLFGVFEPDHLYTITLRPDGGTILEEPVEPVYRAALGQN